MSGSQELLRRLARRAMIERGLLPDFSPAAVAETAALPAAASAIGDPIRDLRDRLWCSIDNEDSRDLDQLTASGPRSDDGDTVLVAIADVDAMVVQGGAVDAHARTNTTSVYTAARVFPMLPERISNDLTSLVESEDRLAVVVEMAVDREGNVGTSTLYRAQVRSRARLVYEDVTSWLEGRGPPPPALAQVAGLERDLRSQDTVAQRLKAQRHRRGALSLESREARPIFRDGALTDLRAVTNDRAKELISDLMIAANGVTARYLEERGFPTLRRLLRSPERWARIAALAVAQGDRLPDEPAAEALEGFLGRQRKANPEGFADLSLSVVKLLGRGEYALERAGQTGQGHFGLAVKDYTHSTAPNRRFPDLVTQRLLKAALAGRPATYGDDELDELARHCTRQEDAASKVARQVRKSAAALLLAPRLGQRFDAIVTGAAAKGTWVRIERPAAEGRVIRGSAGLDVGDRVEVELVATDVERGFVDFARVTGR